MMPEAAYPPSVAPESAAIIAQKIKSSDTLRTGCIFGRMSLFCPPAGFPPHLSLFWPFVWAQILVLRAWVRTTYGKGTLYRWSVTPYGRVFLASIDWIPGEGEEAPALVLRRLAARAQARIAALTGETAATPENRPRLMTAAGIAPGAALRADVTADTSLPLPDP
jgi:hypothetical protein